MIFLVNDANILIDLLKTDLLDIFFQLEFDFQVTDIVFSEIQEKNADELEGFISKGNLKKQVFSFEELVQIQFLVIDYPALSIADCSCLYISQKLDATLLTGDGALRRIATQQEIRVHGILWVLDEMITNGLITKAEARSKLLQLMELNPRLPINECQKRLRSWNPPI